MSNIREIITDLYFEYIEAINTGDKDRYANLFCKDAVWEWTGNPPRQGRDAIHKATDLSKLELKWLFQLPPQFQILEHTADSALVRTYAVELSNKANQGYFTLLLYIDLCVIEDGLWRFKHRRGDRVYHGTADLMSQALYPAPKHDEVVFATRSGKSE